MIAFATLNCQPKQRSEDHARQWAKELGVEVQGVSCVNQDSDGDGYVSCTVKRGNGELMAIECNPSMGLEGGCRIPARKVIP